MQFTSSSSNYVAGKFFWNFAISRETCTIPYKEFKQESHAQLSLSVLPDTIKTLDAYENTQFYFIFFLLLIAIFMPSYHRHYAFFVFHFFANEIYVFLYALINIYNEIFEFFGFVPLPWISGSNFFVSRNSFGWDNMIEFYFCKVHSMAETKLSLNNLMSGLFPVDI